MKKDPSFIKCLQHHEIEPLKNALFNNFRLKMLFNISSGYYDAGDQRYDAYLEGRYANKVHREVSIFANGFIQGRRSN